MFPTASPEGNGWLHAHGDGPSRRHIMMSTPGGIGTLAILSAFWCLFAKTDPNTFVIGCPLKMPQRPTFLESSVSKVGSSLPFLCPHVIHSPTAHSLRSDEERKVKNEPTWRKTTEVSGGRVAGLRVSVWCRKKFKLSKDGKQIWNSCNINFLVPVWKYCFVTLKFVRIVLPSHPSRPPLMSSAGGLRHSWRTVWRGDVRRPDMPWDESGGPTALPFRSVPHHFGPFLHSVGRSVPSLVPRSRGWVEQSVAMLEEHEMAEKTFPLCQCNCARHFETTRWHKYTHTYKHIWRNVFNTLKMGWTSLNWATRETPTARAALSGELSHVSGRQSSERQQCTHAHCARTGVHRTLPRHIFTSMPPLIANSYRVNQVRIS